MPRETQMFCAVQMLTYGQPLPIQENFDILCGSSNIIGPSGHQSHDVLVESRHFEFGQIRLESDTRVIFSIKMLQLHLTGLPHVVCPGLRRVFMS